MAHPVFLSRHPASAPTPPLEVGATIDWDENGALKLEYGLWGMLAAYLIPQKSTPRREEGLWQHTCLECFVLGEDAPAYREFNFSPSGAWQAYHFSRYREGTELTSNTAPDSLQLCLDTNRLSVDCSIPGCLLPPGKALRIGLSVVMEDCTHRLSYWALCHGSGKPDFHHPDTFIQTVFRP